MHPSVFLVSSPSCSTRQLMGMPFPSPGDLPNPGIEPRSSALQADSLPADPQGKPKNTGVGSLSLLQEIFPIQESTRGLLHCRWILHHLQSGKPNDQEMCLYILSSYTSCSLEEKTEAESGVWLATQTPVLLSARICCPAAGVDPLRTLHYVGGNSGIYISLAVSEGGLLE